MKEEVKKDIRSAGMAEITAFLERHQEPKFRAKQIYEWLWNKWVHDFEAMSNLPQSLRSLLGENFYL